MTRANDLHNEAMECVDRAFFARKRGDEKAARQLFEEAFAKESAAIDALEEREREEPMYYVLHRSAATLALDCGLFREAEKIAAKALAGEPYAEIVDELRDVLEEANFHRHLEVRGVTLAPNEIQMSLTGNDVGYGVINPVEFANRVPHVGMMMQYAINFLAKKPFSRDLSSAQNKVYLSLARAGSYAVTFRLAPSAEHVRMPGLDSSNETFNEILGLVRLVDQAADEELQQHVSDPAYLSRFLSLAKKIAPDGERIRHVGFTIQNGESAQLSRRASDVPILAMPKYQKESDETVTIEGRLLFADATKTKRIKKACEPRTFLCLQIFIQSMNRRVHNS